VVYGMTNLIICLMGPTASGKTGLACELVQQFPCEIISVDSAMIYRGMNIGTAKPSLEILAHAPHHLIDILDPNERYSAAQFCSEVARLCMEIKSRGRIPLLVGGTMMYFHALQQGLSSLPEANESVRATLLQETQQYGAIHMHQSLAQVDDLSAARIHPHDTQRVQRALEVYRISGKPLSELLSNKTGMTGYQFVNVILMPEERAWLHERIATRFKQMLTEGLVEEVEALLQQWNLSSELPSMRSVGYRQVFEYLQGEYGEEILLAKGVAATRQLAKRQLTWLRHWPDAHYFVAENPGCAAEVMAALHVILNEVKDLPMTKTSP